MIVNIERRPFFRLLLFWIIGILWYYYFSLSWYSCLFLLVAIGVLFADSIQDKFKLLLPYSIRYWSTSLLTGAIIITLSLLITHYNINRNYSLLPVGLLEYQEYIRVTLLSFTDKLEVPTSHKAVFAAITFGETTFLDSSIRYSFSGIGIAHVLAVSGFHVGVVAALIKMLFIGFGNNRWGRSLKYLISILLIWGFAFTTGMSLPTLRSSIMITLYFVAQLLSRNSDSYNNLFVAAFVLLLIDPWSFFNVGFQLSFIAVWFILYLYPRILLLISVRNPVIAVPWQWTAISLAAQVGTCALSIYYFREFSFLFIITNLFISLLATFIIPAGLIWFLLPEGSWCYQILKGFIEEMLYVLYLVVEKFNAIQGFKLVTTIDFISMLAIYVLIFMAIIYSHVRKPVILLCLLTLILLFTILEFFR